MQTARKVCAAHHNPFNAGLRQIAVEINTGFAVQENWPKLTAMGYFALIYEVVEDYLARRGAYRDDHLRHAREAYNRGELLLGGAFANPADKALLVFRVADPSIVESFARNDPYVVNGLVKRWEVRPWTVVIGNAPDPASSK